MWLLPLPDNADAESHIKIGLTRVNGTAVFPISDAEIARILVLYAAFDAGRGRADNSWKEGGLSIELRNALHDAYDQIQKGGRLKALRALLLQAAKRCPFCGITAVTDLDHHLPRSEFKAFSVYCRNLVPACGPCNNSKRALPGADGLEFIYSYSTDLPDERFFTASCKMRNGALDTTFRIVRTQGLAQDVFETLCYQIYHLDLSRRLADESIIMLGAHIVSLSDVYGDDQSAVRVSDWCRRTADSNRRTFGLNDWRTALFFALADCREFCDGGFLTALGQAAPY